MNVHVVMASFIKPKINEVVEVFSNETQANLLANYMNKNTDFVLNYFPKKKKKFFETYVVCYEVNKTLRSVLGLYK